MIQPYRFAAAAATLLLALASAPAQAGLVTDVIDFMASNFTPTTAGTRVPQDPVSGEITIVFDPTVSTSQSTSSPVTTGITLNRLNIKADFPLGYAYLAIGTSFQLLSLSGVENGRILSSNAGVNDFTLILDLANPTDTLVEDFVYEQDVGSFFEANTITFNVTSTPVPEPSSIALLIAGLAGLAMIRRRRTA